MDTTPDPDRAPLSEAEQIAQANQDDHRLTADVDENPDDEEAVVQRPRLSSTTDPRADDSDEQAPTATRPRA